MQTFRIDEFNNLIVTGNLATLSNEDATKQDLKTLLRMFNTEYPFDTREGVPYYNLSIRNNKELIKVNIVYRVMQDTRVKAVKRIDVVFSNKKMNISLDVILKNGVTINV